MSMYFTFINTALHKTYSNGVHAVDGLNLSVTPGEIYIMLGANGAGKTTTLMLTLGIIEPCSGTITIKGIDAIMNLEL